MNISNTISSLTQGIEAANLKLRRNGDRVRIEQKGGRLTLRATLPPKPGARKNFPHQQHISLGVSANPRGLEIAYREARKVSVLVECREFSWEPYMKQRRSDSDDSPTFGDIFADFKEYFFKFSQAKNKDKPWKVLLRTLNKLPSGEPFSLDALDKLGVEMISQCSTSTSSTRHTTKKSLGQLCTFLTQERGLNCCLLIRHFKAVAGQYSPKERNLPDDQLIEKFHQSITDPKAKAIHGYQATFGLRNHEGPQLDCTPLKEGKDYVLVPNNTKTGHRRAFANPSKWIDLFDLRNSDPTLPIEVGTSPDEVGAKVSRLLARAKIPYNPYDLRHCWAVRSISKWGLRDAALSLGHSPAVHAKTYNKWISKYDLEENYNKKYKD